MKTRYRTLWAWSWLVTLPLTLAWYTWGWSTVRGWRSFGLELDASPMKYPLLEAGRREFDHLLRRGWLALVPDDGRGRDHADDLRTIHLFVPEQNLAQLESDLPQSGFEYVKGGIWDGETVVEANIKYRGDLLWHWAYPKKSLRVRTTRARLFEGIRSMNLIAPKFPEQVNNFLGYRLAHHLGLLAPRVEMVHVAVNGRERGIHVLTEQLEETTLRQNELMPGDLYSGDLIARDLYHGVSAQLFEHPGLWEKRAINNHYPEDHRAPLDRLVALVNAFPTDEVHAELSDLLDMEAFGRFAALEVLSQTMHFDATHNWRLYFDSHRGHFVPVVWDPMGWALRFRNFRSGPRGRANLDVITSRLHAAIYSNADFLRARHAVLAEFFKSGKDVAFLEEVDHTLRSVRSALRVDPNVRPLDADEVARRTDQFRAWIDDVFEDVAGAFVAPGGDVRYRALPDAAGLGLSVAGRRPVERVELDFARPLQGPVAVHVRTLRDGEEILTDVSGGAVVNGQRLTLELGLLAHPRSVFARGGLSMKNHAKRYGPGYYELLFAGIPADNRVLQLRADRGGPALEPAERRAELPPTPLDGLYLAVRERPVFEPVTWRGTIEIDGVRELERDLILEPGTTVRLAPRASLVLRGRLVAEGTALQPIRFLRAEGSPEPWGALALQGPGTSGSLLRHCDFSGGSGLKDDLREYSAMFSVHDAEGVVVDHSSFADGSLVDDMVHAVYAEVAFSDCSFRGAPADALDLDICRGRIERCHFVASGNDAIDLMTTRALVIDTVIEGNEDKGISVGEGSLLLAVNNRLTRNTFGIQVKDGSRADVWNTDFVENEVAIDAYKKNWRYADGGHVALRKSRLEGNAAAATADGNSSIHVLDSFFDGAATAGNDRRVLWDQSVDSVEREAAAVRGQAVLLEEVSALGGLAHDGRSRIDTRRRGARLGER